MLPDSATVLPAAAELASASAAAASAAAAARTAGASVGAGAPSSVWTAAGFGLERLAVLVAEHPVGVSCVHPGGIKTGISRNGRKTVGSDAAAIDRLFEEKLAKMEPARAAQIIVRGILRDKARVLVGIDAHLIHHAAKTVGSRYQDVTARLTKRMMPAREA